MKNYLLILFVAISASLFSQVPQAFNYQVVVRNSAGNPRANDTILFKISITDTVTHIDVYNETHLKTTNQFGLATFEVGKGNVISGSFSAINWALPNSCYLLNTEIDTTGTGSHYMFMGSTQLLSVPFAFHTNNATGVTGVVGVPNGGSGATSLTGYVKGTGTAPLSAVATIPGTDISGNIAGNAANVTGIVAVPNGGTGKSTLTGYVKGSGTSAFTAASTIPGTDITGNIPGNSANVTGIVEVPNGGTGTTSLTGYVKGNGIASLSTVATIPGTDITGNISGNSGNVTAVVTVAHGGTGISSITSNSLLT